MARPKLAALARKAPWIACLLLPLTGCWSTVQIEDLGLVVATSFDLVQGEDTKRSLSVTNQFVTSETTRAGKGGSSPPTRKAYKNVTETGDAVLPILREMTLKNDKRSFAQHAKVIVVGEELARAFSLQQTLDFSLREQEIRPSALVLVASDLARQTLESKEPTVIPAFHLLEISKGAKRSTKILPPITLAKLNGKLNSGTSFLLQKVMRINGDIKFSGAAVIRGTTKKLVGFMSERDLEGLSWLTGEGKGGVVRSADQRSAQPVVYEIKSLKSRIRPLVEGDAISFKVGIEADGRIAENWIVSGKPFDSEFLKRAEKSTQEEVDRLIRLAIDKMQRDFRADVAGFGNRLRIEQPKVWKKVKADWDRTFSKAEIEYTVKINVSDYGTTGPGT